MTPIFTTVKTGFGQHLGEYYRQLQSDTEMGREFKERGLARSMVWVPRRMIDSVHDALQAWRANDNAGNGGKSAFLPVIFVALAEDFTPAPGWARQNAVPINVINPDDQHERIYKLRTSTYEMRAQVVFVAAEPATAHSLAMQFNLWGSGPSGGRFNAQYDFAGAQHDFPVMINDMAMGVVSDSSEQKNLSILTATFSLIATVPMFDAPAAGEPNDGKAAPPGYPVVLDITQTNKTAGGHVHVHMDEAGGVIEEH